jgi:hypothetical protein
MDTRKLDHAFDRFEAALRHFEAALAVQRDQLRRGEAVKGEAEALRLDRSRLAQELDEVRSKASDLIVAHKQVVGKIDAAMSRIQAVLHSNSGS